MIAAQANNAVCNSFMVIFYRCSRPIGLFKKILTERCVIIERGLYAMHIVILSKSSHLGRKL